VANSGWWTKTRGMAREAYESWSRSAATAQGRSVRILAWATTADGYVVASPSALSVGDTDSWTHTGWHEMDRGGWDGATGQLSWSGYHGDPQVVELTDPGRLPEVFRERVSASILLERFVPIVNGRGVTISGRRDPGSPSGQISWHTELGRGLTWQTPGVQTAVDEAVALVRTEYDMG